MSELLACFFTESEKCFRFLETEGGYSYLSGIAEIHEGRKIIRPYYNQNLSGAPLGVTRYENDNIELEFCFSRQSLTLSSYVFYNRTYRFELFFLLSYLRLFRKKSGFGVIEDQAVISETLERISSLIKKNLAQLESLSQDHLGKVAAAQAHQTENTLRAHYKQMLKEVGKDAARAFRLKDYRTVILLLKPHAVYLSRTDRKKLLMAEKKIVGRV